MSNRWVTGITILTMALACAGPAAALTPAEKCQVLKLTHGGKFNFCRLKAKAKAIRNGNPADYSKCDASLFSKFFVAEDKAGPGICPTEGDAGDVYARAIADTDFVALKLAGPRYVDNGDGTVTDTQTGLMWEKKDDSGLVHDKDLIFSWSTGAPWGPDGQAFSQFIGFLNGGTSPDGVATTGCFANHCDWRLPTVAELQGIVDPSQGTCGGGSGACIDPIFGPTVSSGYWSFTTRASSPGSAWYVDFSDDGTDSGSKADFGYVRAVRGGL